MTDLTAGTGHDWTSASARRRVKRRYGADRRLQYYGLGAIALSVLLLGVLFSSLIFTGYVAFYTTKVELAVNFDAAKIDKAKPGDANYRGMAREALLKHFPDVKSKKEQRDLLKIMSNGAPYVLRDYVLANPPFNDSDWFRKDDDVRWAHGLPPKGNANYAWVQHFLHHLAPKGTAGFVLANGSLSSKSGGEGEIRRKLGLNQSQFWSQIGVTQSGGSRYESGRNIPRPVQMLLRIAYGTAAQSAKQVDALRPSSAQEAAE